MKDTKALKQSLPVLESFLEKSKNNYENLKLLFDLYSYDKTVPFIGAGASFPLGILDWSKLLKKLLDSCDDCFQKNNESLLKENDKWPDLAEEIFNHLGNDKYNTIVRQSITPKINSSTLTILKIILATRIQLTTNFDLSIEEGYKFFNFMASRKISDVEEKLLEVKYLPYLEEYPDDKRKNYIYYLHGNKEKDYFILKKSEYDMYYPSISQTSLSDPRVHSLENSLRAFYINSNIIFIGFSFADKYLKNYFFKLSHDLRREEQINKTSLFVPSGKKYTLRKYNHFLIIDSDADVFKNNKRTFFDEFEKNDIYPIVYKSGSHLFIEQLFEQLLSKVKI